MYQYTCPQCRRTTTTATIRDGAVLPCPKCGQRLLVVVEKGAPPAAGGLAAAGWFGPVLAGVGGLGGLTVAGGIILAAVLLGRSPAPDSRGPAGPREVARAAPEKPPPAEPGGGKGEPAGKSEPGGGRPPGEVLERASGGGRPPGDVVDRASGGAGPVLPDLKAPPTLTGEQVYKKVLPSCVWIYARTGTGEAWAGTGALVDREARLVITNEHVANRTAVEILALFPVSQGGQLETDPEYYLGQFRRGRAGKAIAAELVLADRQRDLALIQLAALPAEAVAVPVAAGSVSPGQKLHAVGGHPRGSRGMWIYNSGDVRQVSAAVWQYDDGFRRSGTVIESTMPINQGDSGGPVVDGRGILVGVNANYDPQSRQNSSHIDVSEVRDLLTRYFRAAGKEWAGAVEPPPAAAVGEHVRQLARALDNPDAEVRRQAAAALGAYGRDARDALPALLRLLRAPAQPEDVRTEAARALGQIGVPDRDQVPALRDALRDPRSKPARLYAADALAQLGEAAKPAVPSLVLALRDTEPEVRRAAAAALGKIGFAARAEAYGDLLDHLQDPSDDVRRAALGALIPMGRPDADRFDTLRGLLGNPGGSREGRIYAALALSTVGAEAVPPLLDALAGDPDPGVATMVCSALGEVGVKTDAVAQALGKALDRPEKTVRVAAAGALGQLGIDGTTLPALLKALGMRDLEGRRAALAGLPPLGAFVKDPPRLHLSAKAAEPCRAALAADEAVARAVAAYLLGQLGTDAGPAVPDLRQALAREKDEMARREMLCALAELGPTARPALPDLRVLLNDPTPPKVLQTCAALAVAQVADWEEDRKPAYPILVKALIVKNVRDPNPVEQELCLRAQQALQKGKRPAAEAIARIELQGNDPDTLAASRTALYVLGKIGPAARGGMPLKKDPVWVFLKAADVGNQILYPDIAQTAREALDTIYGPR